MSWTRISRGLAKNNGIVSTHPILQRMARLQLIQLWLVPYAIWLSLASHSMVESRLTVNLNATGQPFVADTSDLFQAPPLPQEVRNALIVEVKAKENSADCEYLPPAKFVANSAAGNGVIAYISLAETKKAGCQTMYQTAWSIQQNWVPSARLAGYPPVKAMVIGFPKLKKGHIGSPFVDYKQKLARYPIGLPETHVALLDATDDTALETRLDLKDGKPIFATLSPQPGPYNDVFQSRGYLAFTFTLVGISGLIVLYSAWNFVRGIRAGTVGMDFRTAVFLSGLIGMACFAVMLPMQYHSWPRFVLGRFITLVTSCAFLLLLNVWLAMLMPTGQTPGKYSPVRLVLYTLILLLALRILLDVVQIVQPSRVITTIMAIDWYIYALFMLYTAGIFVFYASRFYSAAKLSVAMRSSMVRLMAISLMGAGSFLLKGMTTYAYHHYAKENGEIGFSVVTFVAKYSTTVLRCIAILLVLNVRLPKEGAGQNGENLTMTKVLEGGEGSDYSDFKDHTTRLRGHTEMSETTMVRGQVGAGPGAYQQWTPKAPSPVADSNYAPERFPDT